jgi:hypothetical protein
MLTHAAQFLNFFSISFAVFSVYVCGSRRRKAFLRVYYSSLVENLQTVGGKQLIDSDGEKVIWKQKKSSEEV